MLLLNNLFQPDSTILDLHSVDRWQAVEEIVTNFVTSGRLAQELREHTLSGLKRKEAMLSGSMGFAFPHFDIPEVDDTIWALGRSKNGIDWDDDCYEMPVYFVFLVVASHHRFHVETQVQFISIITHGFGCSPFPKRLLDLDLHTFQQALQEAEKKWSLTPETVAKRTATHVIHARVRIESRRGRTGIHAEPVILVSKALRHVSNDGGWRVCFKVTKRSVLVGGAQLAVACQEMEFYPLRNSMNLQGCLVPGTELEVTAWGFTAQEALRTLEQVFVTSECFTGSQFERSS